MEMRTMRSGEIGVALGLSAATVQAYARTGRIPARQTPGGQYRFDLDEVRSVLAPPVLELADDLVDIFDTPVATDALSAYRNDPVDGAAERRLRIRGVRASRPIAPAVIESPTAGAEELAALIQSSGAAAMVVLCRDSVDA